MLVHVHCIYACTLCTCTYMYYGACENFMQERFTEEVYQSYESLLAICDSVKSGTDMLSNRSAAQQIFKQFDDISARVTR